MNLSFKPRTNLEKFGFKVYSALVENFSQTFFVGGMMRDWLLGKKITDIDIATEALPEQTTAALKEAGIKYDETNRKFGSIVAKQGALSVEITTLRKDLKASNRYTKVAFITSPQVDSKRRDFTINSLYFSPKSQKILDFQGGLQDLQKKQIRFIGQADERIKQDSLRVLRALRFVLVLNFKLEKKTKQSIKNNFATIDSLTKTKINKEIKKITNPRQRKILTEVINNPKSIDKYFK